MAALFSDYVKAQENLQPVNKNIPLTRGSAL